MISVTQCSCWTTTRHERGLVSHGGNQCTRPAKYVDAKGQFYCAQHAKEPATVLRKATGRLRDGLREINSGARDFDWMLDTKWPNCGEK